MFKKGNNIFSLLIIILSVFMTSSVNTINAATADSGSPGTTETTPGTGTSSGAIQKPDAGTSQEQQDQQIDADTSLLSSAGSKDTATKTLDKDASASDATTTTSPKEWGDSLITNVQLQDSKGNPLTEYTQNQSMRAYWEFSSGKSGTNQIIHEGDTMVVKVPEQLALSNDDTNIVYEKGSSTELGTSVLNAKDRTITITFNSNAAKLSEDSSTPVIGSFWVNVSWDVNNTEFGKDINLQWTSDGTAATNPGSGGITVKPELPDSNEVLYKYGGFDQDIIHWSVRVNYAKQEIKDAIYKDTIGNNQKLLTGTDHPIVAYPTSFDSTTGKNTDDKSNGSIIQSTETNDNGFTVHLGDLDKTPVMIYYDTQITNPDKLSPSYGNTGDLLSTTHEIQNVPVNISTNKLGSDAGANTDITSVVGHKLWNVPDKTTIPENVTIDLLADNKKIKSQTVSANNDWFYEFTNLPKYNNDNTEIKYTVQEEQASDSIFTAIPSTANYDITNIVTPDKTKYTVTKAWNDGKDANDHDPIMIGIFDGAGHRPKDYPDDVSLNKGNNWTYTFTGLDPDTIWYTSETNLPAGYMTIDSTKYGNDYDKVITNTASKNLTVSKKWINTGNTGKLPTEVSVQLYADGNPIGNPTTLNDKNDWKGTLQIPTRDSNGNEITSYTVDGDKIIGHSIDNGDTKLTEFTVKENDVAGYTSTQVVKTDSVDITNTYGTTAQKRDFSVTKKWVGDKESDRPQSIQVKLTADGKDKDSPVTLKPDKDGNWTHTWKDLDKQKDGKNIVYSAREVTDLTDKYSTTVDNSDSNNTVITNTFKNPSTPTTHLKVTKIWSDDNNKDGIRPKNVTIQLTKDKNPIGDKVTLNADNNWTYTFDDLEEGPTYSVREDNANNDDYASNVDKPDATDATITNTHTPTGHVTPPTDHNDKTISVKKIWNDKNDQDGIRPESVQVQLFANGDPQGDPITLNADNNWSYAWNNLNQGTNYTVKEVGTIDGYTSTDLTNGNQTTITNTHTPTGHVTPPTDHNDKIISVKKIWNDKNNQDGIRPESVQVQLFANGNAQGNPITLNVDNNWYYAWNNLNQGTNYTVKEVGKTDGYTSTTLTDGNYTTITNTHTPKTPGTPGTPQTPGTPSNPGTPSVPGNPGNPGTPLTPGTPYNPSTPSTPGTPDTPGNPAIPSIPPYTPSNPPATDKTPDNPFGYLPQTGSKDANIMYTVIGLILLGLVSTYVIRKRFI